MRKSLASRYYQLLTGHAVTGSFLHERMTGLLQAETSECRWCGSGKRESRHHLSTECEAWRPQIRRLWRRVGKDCGWKHPRAPAVRKLWREEATEAVLEFLRTPGLGVGWRPGERGGQRRRQARAMGGNRAVRGRLRRRHFKLSRAVRRVACGPAICTGLLYRLLSSFPFSLCFLISLFTWFAAGLLTGGAGEWGAPV